MQNQNAKSDKQQLIISLLIKGRITNVSCEAFAIKFNDNERSKYNHWDVIKNLVKKEFGQDAILVMTECCGGIHRAKGFVSLDGKSNNPSRQFTFETFTAELVDGVNEPEKHFTL